MVLNQEDFELKIEITERCNATCTFCHQDFGNMKSLKQLDMGQVKFWIDWAARGNISSVRFTGGEPTLHPHLLDMCKKTHDAGLYVTINTNGYTKFVRYERIFPYVDMLKISLPLVDKEKLDKLTGIPNSLEKKLKTITASIEKGFEVQLLTAMVPENIGLIEEYILFVKDIPNLTWAPLRIESSPQDEKPISDYQIIEMAREISRLMDEYPGRVPKLGLATPFCAVEPIELGAKVFAGRGEDCGPFKSLTVTAENELISCYSCRNPITNHNSVQDVRLDKEYQYLADINILPLECQKCDYLTRCMGGCSSPYARVAKSGGQVDYLAKFNGVS
jgi:radical SAM protein with 4Fe4S-binding SPASM domain|tara:strand:+ start:2368 stop:3366 length:999 start_codon:yes stop_codon:yes gene_type:complete